MDPTKNRQMEDERTFMRRMMKGATAGLMPGIIWGVFAADAAAQVEPPAGRPSVSSDVILTLKIIGSKGLICAGAGVIWVGVKLVVEKYRMERDYLNDVAGGFVAGAALAGLRWRRIPVAISAGTALASVPVFLDSGGIFQGEPLREFLQDLRVQTCLFILYNIRRIRSNQKSLSGK